MCAKTVLKEILHPTPDHPSAEMKVVFAYLSEVKKVNQNHHVAKVSRKLFIAYLLRLSLARPLPFCHAIQCIA